LVSEVKKAGQDAEPTPNPSQEGNWRQNPPLTSLWGEEIEGDNES